MKIDLLKRQLKKYRNADFDIKQHLMKYYIEDEQAILPIHISKKEDLFSSFDPNHLLINPEIISYIEQIVYYIPYQYSIVLKFSGLSFTKKEKEQLVKAFTSTFGLVAHDKKVDLYFNDKKALILFTLGFVILYLSYFLLKDESLRFVYDVVSIVGTFAIWEFVDTIWFDRTNLKIANLNAGQLAVAKITFEEK